MCVCVPGAHGEGIGFSGTRVTGSCELPDMGLEPVSSGRTSGSYSLSHLSSHHRLFILT